MSAIGPLTLQLVETHPATAAQVLGTLDTTDAAAFLNSAPTEAAAATLAHLGPVQAARLVEKVEPEAAGKILSLLNDDIGIQILRAMEDRVRARLLARLPMGLSRHFSAALGYNPQLVGAWTNREVLTQFQADTVGSALAELRKNGRSESQIYLIDGDRRYAGLIRTSDLLLAAEDRALSRLVSGAPDAIDENATLGSVVGSTAWDSHTGLPVVDRRGRLIGELTRRGLRLGLVEALTPRQPETTVSLLAEIGSCYLDVTVHLINEAAPLPPSGTASGRYGKVQ